jgi:hypothetical protein
MNVPNSKTDDRFLRTVTCAWCGNCHTSAVPGDLDSRLQGIACASDVVLEDGRWIVRGSYGSREHDMERYVFVAHPPSAPADPVCDTCVSERIHAGDLVSTSPEMDRREADFAPRPAWAHDFVYRIRVLLKEIAVTRRVVDAACRTHGAAPRTHGADREASTLPSSMIEVAHGPACEICAAVDAYSQYQQWNHELEDGGRALSPQEGRSAYARHLREAARQMEDLAAFLNEDRPDNEVDATGGSA